MVPGRATGGMSGKTTGSTFHIEPAAWVSLFGVPRFFILLGKCSYDIKMLRLRLHCGGEK